MREHEEIQEKLIEVANRRYATKKFNPDRKIDDDDWRTILEVGRLSPSSFGYEPWQFVELDNPQMRQDLKPIAWSAVNSINGADKLLLIFARKDVTYDSDYVKYMVQDVKRHEYDPNSKSSQAFKHFQEADMDINDERTRFDWACKQCYIAMANMMTAAAALKIDSCPIEGFNREKVEAYLAEKGILDRQHWGVAVMVSFGYRDEPIKPKSRQTLTDIYRTIK